MGRDSWQGCVARLLVFWGDTSSRRLPSHQVKKAVMPGGERLPTKSSHAVRGPGGGRQRGPVHTDLVTVSSSALFPVCWIGGLKTGQRPSDVAPAPGFFPTRRAYCCSVCTHLSKKEHPHCTQEVTEQSYQVRGLVGCPKGLLRVCWLSVYNIK